MLKLKVAVATLALCVGTVLPAAAQLTWYWDPVLPAPTTGVSAGIGGGYWIIDPLTEGKEAVKWAFEEAAAQLAQQRRELENQQQKAWDDIEKMIGPATDAPDFPEFQDIKVDPAARAMREETIRRLRARQDADRFDTMVKYFTFIDRQEVLLLVYQQRLKALEAQHKGKLTWQERLQLQSRLGLLGNQLELESIKQGEAASTALTDVKLKQAELLRAKLQRRRAENRANSIVPIE